MKLVISLFVLVLSGLSFAGPVRQSRVVDPFFVETFFDDTTDGKLSEFSFVQEGVTVTVTPNTGTLMVIDGVIYPSNPDSGMTISTSQVVDKFEFYGPVLTENPFCLRIAVGSKGGTAHLSLVDMDNPGVGETVGVSNSSLNKVAGFVLVGVGLDYLRFDEYGR